MTAFDLIAQRIRERGPITVAEFMALALYHPEHGYYARTPRRTGRNGDFFTSVDVGPIFGVLLARQFAQMWRLMSPEGERLQPDAEFDLVEAGAANGQLARDVLDAASAHDRPFYEAIRLHLVESSPAARAAQQHMLGPHADKRAGSGTTLPDAVHGVIYANELLDALPVHRVCMTQHGLRELFIDLHDGRLVERAGPASTDAFDEYLRSAGVRLEPGWRAEINLAALAWMARACAALHRGFLLLIDYGHHARDLYSATHASGTMTTFHRHVADAGSHAAPWLSEPGLRDITSHVDLTSIQRVAEQLGCTTLGMLDQSYFLMALGLPELLEIVGPSVADTRRRLALKTLLLPGGLGSTHKVMVFAKDVDAPQLQGFSGIRRLT